MTLKKLVLRLFILILLSSFVIIGSVTFFIYHRANKSSQLLENQLLETAYDIYASELSGSIIINNPKVIQALIDDLAGTRNLRAKLVSNSRIFYSHAGEQKVFSRSFQLVNGNMDLGILSLSVLNGPRSFSWKTDLVGPLVFELIVIVLLGLILLRLLTRSMFDPLSEIVRTIHLNDIKNLKVKNVAIRELFDLGQVLISMHREIEDRAKSVAVAEIAAQVAHDIRSPLAALSMIEPELSVLPEDSRVILRHAISRIRDIANQLLGQSKSTQSKDQDERTRVLLPSVLDAILSEKRVNYRDRSAIEIEGQIDPSTYGIFAEVQPLEFGRIISNLINNSVEAMDGQGRIEVALSLQESEAVIVIKDNGKGIPAEVLKKLGQRGVTHGKAGGSGLGLYHARSKVEEWGGKLVMTSEVGRGTQVTIRLPKVGTPQWFVSQIKLKSLQTVVILDDDSSIHEVWKKRFGSQALGGKSIHLVHCSTPLELRQFVASNKISPILYLCDYELLGSKETGLDLIQECGIQNQAILVTSRFEESSLRQRCEGLEVRLIPKSLATLVPISVS